MRPVSIGNVAISHQIADAGQSYNRRRKRMLQYAQGRFDCMHRMPNTQTPNCFIMYYHKGYIRDMDRRIAKIGGCVFG